MQYAIHDASGEVVSVLLEDGLELWSLLMKLPSLQYSESLHVLFQSLLLVYSHNMKCFPSIMSILDSYYFIGKEQFIQSYAAQLSAFYQTLFSVVSPRDMTRLATSIHCVALVYPRDSVVIVADVARRILHVLFERERSNSNGECV